MNADQLLPDEPLSPELVLILSPELRAQALASLGPPSWPTPRPRPRTPIAPRPTPIDEPFARTFAQMLMARTVQLAVIFVFVTLVTLALSLVAQAFR